MRIPLLTQGFRPFFLIVGIWSVIALAAWIIMFETGTALPSRFAPIDWHIHEMMFGMVMAAIAGFLLTAIPNWTARLPVSGAPLLLLVLSWVLGRATMAVSAHLPLYLSISADLAFTASLIAVVAREIIAGRNWHHLTVVVPLGLLFAANLLMHLAADGAEVPYDLGWRLALAAICFLVALIGGRIIPSFTRNWLKKNRQRDLPPGKTWLTAAALISMSVGMIGWAVLPQSRLFAVLLILSAALHLALLAGWRGFSCWSEPLLFILHVGYGWLVAGLLLLGLADFNLGVTDSSALHALTVGAIGTMVVAVMTRASRGHTGRALEADGPEMLLYVSINAAALLRVLAGSMPHSAPMLLPAAAVLWIAAFGLFVFSYAPILCSRRPS